MFSVQQVAARKVVGFHWLGPWEETVPLGFEKLVHWAANHHLDGELLAVYYDDPDVVPAEQLRCDTVMSVPDDFVLPEDAQKNVRVMTIAEDLYAIGLASVQNNAFFEAWEKLFDQVEADGRYQLTGKPCYERYLNDGILSGEWQLEMLIPVKPMQE
ncbi:GyrI-like domain-containing protein [Klebsiella sp. BIGb0407]|uniref:GyrI-like domain-containing protein n=1 Tax=Klebsiella sp. BIGb0407 TaxID=2940603 RepID=UPI002169283B|nr:GyrI-like domain-containing protein [Klebsiella sp. BIGb0407]MCS3430503.1 DNA gyrase inhibitor [Klebsiella sp. BIGb0407]